MVAAADLLGAARRLHQQVAAVRADVGQAAQRAAGVARQQQRLVEAARQHLARRQRTGRGDVVDVADPLPAAREHAFLDALVRGRVAVERAGQRAGARDVGIDAIGLAQRDLSGERPGHHATGPACGDTADCPPRRCPMTLRSPATNARLIYTGVALASGGIAFYVPLLLSAVGLAHSGTWAAGILFGTNLGRLVGSHVASRHGAFTQRSGVIVGNILLEGLALFSMAFLATPWQLVTVATVAGLGSGMSFPGMKNALLRLDGLDGSRAFAGLSMSLRLGMAGGYLAGALVGGEHLVTVFSVLLAMFVAYAGFMRVVLRGIEAAQRRAPPAAHAEILARARLDGPAVGAPRRRSTWAC